MTDTTKKKILLIEDEKPLAHALQLKLEHEGFEVKTVENGDDGLAIIEKENDDLLLCDLIIHGLNGFQVLEKIKEKNLKTPVMIMTNLTQEEDKKRAFDLGAIEFFVKSDTTISEIVESVKTKLNKSS